MLRRSDHGMLFAASAVLAALVAWSPAGANNDIVADVLAGGDAAVGIAEIVMVAAENQGAEVSGKSATPAHTGEAGKADSGETKPQDEVDAQKQAANPLRGIRAPNQPQPTAAEHMPELEPYQLIRSLQFVQDSVVKGDHSAMDMQRFLLGAIDERLRKADQSVFDNPRNVDAALIYAMSGGNPATLDLLALQDRFGNFDNEITTVLRAYLDGRAAQTTTSLEDIVATYRNSDISPYLALVAANVKAGLNEEGALEMFDWARLGAPGTIIEEAALRRSLAIAARNGLLEKAIDYATIYARRFIDSPYAGQFADQLVDLTIDHFDVVGAERLTSVLAFLDRPRQREVYLRIARKAAIAGQRELALLASGKAKSLSSGDDLAPAALAGLYSNLANISSNEVVEINEALAELENIPLSPRDAALRRAARLIANEIVREPDPNSLTQAFSPKIETQVDDNRNTVSETQAMSQSEPRNDSPELQKLIPKSEGIPELASTEIGMDPEFRNYLEVQSKLIGDIDQLLAGENGVGKK